MRRLSPEPPNGADASSWAESRPRFLSIVLVFIAFCSFLAFRLNVWQDEAYTLHTTGAGFAYALRAGTFFEAQAPLYFPILELWRIADHSLFFARLLSIAASLVTILICRRFAARYLRAVRPDAVALVVAFNPFVVWASVEARPYALALALSTALLYALFRGWYDDDAYVPARVWFVVLAVLAAYTQYYVTTLVVAGAVMLVACGRMRRLAAYVAAGLCILAAISPLAVIVPKQMSAYTSVVYAGNHLPPLGVFQILPDFVFPHRFVGSWSHNLARNALYLAVVIIPIVLAARSIRFASDTFRALAVVTIALCTVFAAFVFVHVPVVWPRQTAVVFAPTILAVFALAEGVASNRRRALGAAFGSAYGILTVLSLWTDYHGLAKAGDWQRVGSYLRANVGPNDAVVVFDEEASLPLHYYFDGRPIAAIPRPLTFDRFDENDFAVRSEEDVRASLGDAARGRAHVWLVENDVCKTGAVFYGCRFVDSYVDKNFVVARTVTFDGSSIRELLARPQRDAVGSLP